MMAYISLPSNLNAVVGITSYYCVILKMVILHDSTRTIQNEIFVGFFQRTKTFVSFQKNTKIRIKKAGGLFFF